MDDRFREFRLPANVPGCSIAVVDDGQIAWAGGFGVREEGSGEAVTTGTLFQACSISKAVTAVAVLRLVEEQRIDLDEAVDRYLVSWHVPAGDWDSSGVTVRRLLSHTAGINLPWSAGYYPEQEIPTLLEVLNGEKPSNYPAIEVAFTPGLKFEYSGGGYCILQQLLIDVMGKPFPELMRELVLDPLGMEQSTFEQPLPPGLWDSAARGHRAGGKRMAGGWRVYPEMALGGLWTTSLDLCGLGIELQRALAGHENTLLSKETVSMMLTPQADAGDRGAVGLGVFMEGGGEGRRFGHPGDNEGYTAYWSSLVERGQGVVIMTNSDEGWQAQGEMLGMVEEAYAWPVGA